MLLQVADQPQLQRVHAGNEGAIRQREPVAGVGVVQTVRFAAVQVGQVSLEERGEFGALGAGPHRTVDHGETIGAEPHLLHELRERAVGAETAQLIVELIEERASFAFGKADEILRARGVSPILDQIARERQMNRHVVPDDVAHQPHEHEVDRMAKCLGDAHPAAVVVRVEVGELMQAAAGEETIPRAGRIVCGALPPRACRQGCDRNGWPNSQPPRR